MINLYELLAGLPRDTVLYAVILAVIISPWVYRARARLRRYMRMGFWIVLGFSLGFLARGFF